MSLYGVFGNPIKHSLSPTIHAQFGKQTEIEITYQKIKAEKDDFIGSAKAFIRQGAAGFNITTPFKLDAFKLATKLLPNAKNAAAVNTIKVAGTELIGENTDGVGLVRDLNDNLNINLTHKTILILGAGGAGRGIVLPLLNCQPKRILIANRNAAKAVLLAKDFATFGEICGFGLEKIKSQPVDIIINATSASLSGQMPNIADGVADGAVCYDLMYGQQTPFMAWGSNNNAKMVTDGLGMLVEQAAASFALWTGVKPKTQPVITQLKNQQVPTI